MLIRLLSAALAAGFLAAVVVTGLELTLTSPLIVAAERYETKQTHQADRGLPVVLAHAGHDHATPDAAPEWQPGEGLPRMAFTALATLMGGVGYALLLGAAILAVLGVVQLVKAAKGSFLRYLAPSVAKQAWVQWSGRAGYAARGIVFLISGYLLACAGIEEQAREAGGMARVLSWLTSPFDIIIGVGLLAFGLFSLVEARYRQLHDVPVDDAILRATSWR